MIHRPDIDPVAFSIGPIAVHWYGISYLVGITLAWVILYRHRNTRFSTEQLADLVFFVTLGLFLGGRLGYVLFYNLPYYIQHPLEIVQISRGGMSFHGGLLGVLVVFWWIARRWGKSFFEVADYVAPVVPIGLFFGRLGNFINGELWGRPSNVPWAMVFPRVDQFSRHPSQLYEAALEGILLFVLIYGFARKSRPVMSVSALFLLGYGVVRFAVEWTREPDLQIGFILGGNLTLGQLLSLPMIGLGIVLLILAYRRPQIKNQ